MPVSVQMFAFNAAIAAELKERIAALAVSGVPATFQPSKYQAAIFDWIKTESGSGIVTAVAGSGKTTTCVYGLSYIPNVDLARASASTFHSAGFSALRKHLGTVKVDGSKMRWLLTDKLSPSDFELYSSFVLKLVSLAKGMGVGVLCPDTTDTWAELIRHHDLSLDSEDAKEERAIEIAREALTWSELDARGELRGTRIANYDAGEKRVDFDDQLYLPLLWKLKLWQNDVVIIDEAQDTNPVRRALAKLALRPGGRLIAVGDERQSIYGFTGASVDAMDLIRREFSCHDLPLTVSYRCSKAVVARAKSLVPYLEAAESAPEGSVSYKTLKETLALLGPSDAILCRNVAPIVGLAFSIIATGRGCHVLGRDIGAGLVNLVKKQKAKGVEALLTKLALYREREVAKFTAKGEEQKADSLSDRIACIEVIAGHLSEIDRTVPALIQKIESMFSDSGSTLTLSTMHKSKGKEYLRVAIYRPDLCPSKWARQDWQQAQERNLLYVAWTRAKLDLIDIVPGGEE